MDAERWQKIKSILDALAEASASERPALLSDACEGDAELRSEIERFLTFEEEADDFIETPAWKLKTSTDRGASEEAEAGVLWNAQEIAPGERIGPYRIERLLGQGGMGEVYLANREDDFSQRVAIKLVRSDAAGSGVASRFLHERQVLANLQHPMIARLLDGGSSEKGQPYLVMEYVEGVHIDVYCQEQSLSLRQRVLLFRKVCEAVEYAHRNLIVHRDLKTSNILISRGGTPRLLDFGIAKLMHPDTLQGHLDTLPGGIPITPAYASPEQLRNDTITTASDVYALGVLLYKLFTGCLPYQLEGIGYAELVRRICVQDPIPPSARVASPDSREDQDTDQQRLEDLTGSKAVSAVQATTSLRRWRRQLRGDLDAIVMKALRKEPGERYSSVALFAEDLGRYLDGLPVSARRGNWHYYTGKFLRRNKLVLWVATLVTLLAISSTVLWLRAEAQRQEAVSQQQLAEDQSQRAERQQARAQRLVELMQGLFESADPEKAKGENLTVLEVLDHGRREIDETLADEPDLYAEMLGTLGTVYNTLGLYDASLEAKQKAFENASMAYPRGHVEVAKHLNNLARLYYDRGDFLRAEELMRQVLEMRRQLSKDPSDLVQPRLNLVSVLLQRDQLVEAEELSRQVLEIQRQEHGPLSLEVAAGLYRLGVVSYRRGELEEAEKLYREALEIRLSHDAKSLKVAQLRSSLARVLYDRANFTASWDSYEQALAIRRELEGEGHPRVLKLTKQFADQLFAQRKNLRACKLIEQLSKTPDVGTPDPELRAEVESLARDCVRTNASK